MRGDACFKECAGRGLGRGGVWSGHQAVIFLFFWFTQLTCLQNEAVSHALWFRSFLFLWEGRELPPFFNGREGMTSFFENPRLSPEVLVNPKLLLYCHSNFSQKPTLVTAVIPTMSWCVWQITVTCKYNTNTKHILSHLLLPKKFEKVDSAQYTPLLRTEAGIQAHTQTHTTNSNTIGKHDPDHTKILHLHCYRSGDQLFITAQHI